MSYQTRQKKGKPPSENAPLHLDQNFSEAALHAHDAASLPPRRVDDSRLSDGFDLGPSAALAPGNSAMPSQIINRLHEILLATRSSGVAPG
ncbi:MAG: hypothetical protein AUI36_23275 [Cyanobacteria bacterium 13_1_40CM_2_61_4]|nr:MAG: hypothetical protein AUI36_23275 [Cyanobacteria bacterium 13_1_40CM_2_61_4]